MSEYRIVFANSTYRVEKKVECPQTWRQKLLDAKPAECWRGVHKSYSLGGAKSAVETFKAAEKEGVIIA